MGIGLEAFKALLPRSKAWVKANAALYSAIGAVADKVIETQNDVFESLFTDSALDEWEQQFGILNKTGLTTTQRIERIAGKWASIGGSLNNADLTFAVQAQGFTNLEVLQYWQWPDMYFDYLAPTQTPPNDGTHGYYLVNKLDNLTPIGGFECGNGECSDQAGDAEAGGYSGYAIKRVYYPVRHTTSEWITICAVGSTSPDVPTVADVDADRQDELENLIVRIKPANRYAALMVRYI